MSFNGSVIDTLVRDCHVIARDILVFQPHVVEANRDILFIAEELRNIGDRFRVFRMVLSDPRNVHDVKYCAPARDMIIEVTKCTLRDLAHLIRNRDHWLVGRTHRNAYILAWRDLQQFFFLESNNSLSDRLHYFVRFLEELCPILDGKGESREYAYLHDRIDSILASQDAAALDERARRLSIHPERVAPKPLSPFKTKSFERKRPGNGVSPAAPPINGAFDPILTPPTSPPGMGRFPNDRPEPARPQPDIVRPPSPPASSVFTGASTVSLPSTAGSDMAKHWLMGVFGQSRPTTEFKSTGPESFLHDTHKSDVTAQLKKKSYREYVILNFDKRLAVKIFLRQKDLKARIYCKDEKGKKKVVACQALSNLHVVRKESNLMLCQPEKNKKKNPRSELWLDLRFPSYEQLILFYCAFMALKIQDESQENPDLGDHFLQGEKHVFSGTIIDDNFRHALQIYKDKHSGGIRLQASVLTGPLKRAPVWTAFINYRVASLKWIKRAEPRKIHLGDLQRYVFIDDYTPQVGPKGEHELHFDTSKVADEFERVIEDLAEGRHDD